MEYSQDHMTSQELGLSLGILMGIAALQSTGDVFALLTLTIIGSGLGMLVGRLIHSHRSWTEEE